MQISSVGIASGSDLAAASGGQLAQSLLAENRARFGIDTASLASKLGELSLSDTLAVMKDLSPVEQGQLLRAMDGAKQSGRPEAESFTCKADSVQKSDRPDAESYVRTKHPITGAPISTAKTSTATSVPHVPLDIAATFGADAARLAARSPSLMADMQTLQNERWTVVAAHGGGTSCDRQNRVITIDVDANSSAAQVVRALAHEAGHARHVPSIDESSRASYIRSMLADEGAATLANIRTQREIIAAGGADIGISGNPANHPAYIAAYDTFLVDGDAVKARDAIGAIFGSGETTSTTGQTYADYYGGAYDAAHPPTP